MKFLPRVMAGVALLLGGSAAAWAAGRVEVLSRIDSPSDTAEGTSLSITGSGGLPEPPANLSADGRYAVFVSDAPNLVSGQPNGFKDNVYLYDRQSATTTLVSHAQGTPNRPGNDLSDCAALSADGRWVAFVSFATDLVAGSDPVGSLYLWDRLSGAISLVSRSAVSGNNTSTSYAPPEISADGRWIAFASSATDLVPGQTDANHEMDVFFYDRTTATTTLVSRSTAAVTTAGNGPSQDPSLSTDGRFVAFLSAATDLVSGTTDGNGGFDVFLWDRDTGTKTLLSRSASNAAATANGSTSSLRISADGLWIAFASRATNLIPGQTDGNGADDAFLASRASGAVTLVSHSTAAPTATAQAGSGELSISADGGSLAFVSAASDLAPGQAGSSGVFLWQRSTNASTLVSRPASAEPATSASPMISDDGRWVVFLSDSTSLIAGQGDGNGASDVFLYDRDAGGAGGLTLVSRSQPSATQTGDGGAAWPTISGNGSQILFNTFATDLEAGLVDANDLPDVALYDRAAHATTVISRRASDMPAVTDPGGGGRAVLNGTGVVYVGAADPNQGNEILYRTGIGSPSPQSLVSGSYDTHFLNLSLSQGAGSVAFMANDGLGFNEGNGGPDVFFTDGGLQLVSHSRDDAGTTGDAGSFAPSISADGSLIAFVSTAHDLVPGQATSGFSQDVFLWSSGAITLVSRSAGGGAANGASEAPVLSGDGRFILFPSSATDLVAGQGQDGLFLHDRTTALTSLVSPGFGRVGSRDYGITPDGRWIAFSSTAPDLVPGQIDPTASPDVFLFDRETGTTTLVSHNAGSPLQAGDSGSGGPQLSANGRWVGFTSRATDLAPGQTDAPGTADVFLFDRLSGETRLVSHASGAPATAADAPSSAFALSADGSAVAFASDATDLVAGQIDRAPSSSSTLDFFLWDRTSGRSELASRTLASPVEAANYGSGRPTISSDGHFVVFESAAENLVAGDYNHRADVFDDQTGSSGVFFTLPPCRLLDTREAAQGPALTSGVTRDLGVYGRCGVPERAVAVAVNVTITQPSGAGYLTCHPKDMPRPLASTINFSPADTRANNAILPLAADGTFSIAPLVSAAGSVHVIVDVTGYFE
jgi:Tol biopolymer transport system component